LIVIIGAGLAGLSAACHLAGRERIVLEREPEPGGLCRSRRVGEFTFDLTGHLLHLRDPEVIALVDRLLPGVFREIERAAAIRSSGRLVPYPFQANTYGLPPEVVCECVLGFWKTLGGGRRSAGAARGDSFRDWALATFGEGIARHFMFPYNEKLWRRDLREITADWVSWSVPKPTFEEVLKGALGITNTGLGYNARFRYPKQGGIAVLPQALAAEAPDLRLGIEVVGVDASARAVRLSSGGSIGYSALVSTAPLPWLLSRTTGLPDEVVAMARPLAWVDIHCLNLALARPGALGHHWIYFPEPEFPFYRVGSPTAFSDGVAPPGTSSLYVEIACLPDETPDQPALVDGALEGLCRAGILRDSDEILVRDVVRISPAYVVFDRARRAAIGPLLKRLRGYGIHAIGRYGSWTYSYMEEAIRDGMRVARLLSRGKEKPEPLAGARKPGAGHRAGATRGARRMRAARRP